MFIIIFLKLIINYLQYWHLIMLFNISFNVWWFFFSQMISALNNDNANSFDTFQFVSKTQRTQLKFPSKIFFNYSLFFKRYCGLATYCFPSFDFLKNVPSHFRTVAKRQEGRNWKNIFLEMFLLKQGVGTCLSHLLS